MARALRSKGLLASQMNWSLKGRQCLVISVVELNFRTPFQSRWQDSLRQAFRALEI